jgi:hypothetical protein
VGLVILVVIQSTTGRPPLQLKLSTRRSQFPPDLRHSPHLDQLNRMGVQFITLRRRSKNADFRGGRNLPN